jgi:hypothetical protein
MKNEKCAMKKRTSAGTPPFCIFHFAFLIHPAGDDQAGGKWIR